MKKIMKIAFVAAFAAVTGYGVYTNQRTETMSDLMLANVEALASGESDADPNTFYGYKATNCYDGDRLVGATCAQTQPGDECKRSAVWGKCNK
ncbi:NVEALA domain-containing protein [uncultured Bacteroides sp.]|uniref:NVEALA domain-containing protein n=1 Tax=uncultured Bacteroides sp. TaxID=162156 RepID=UPI0025935B2A|nr:NVEALA domain-containing protein [uncultured Bacteroides sp.]